MSSKHAFPVGSGGRRPGGFERLQTELLVGEAGHGTIGRERYFFPPSPPPTNPAVLSCRRAAPVHPSLPNAVTRSLSRTLRRVLLSDERTAPAARLVRPPSTLGVAAVP